MRDPARVGLRRGSPSSSQMTLHSEPSSKRTVTRSITFGAERSREARGRTVDLWKLACERAEAIERRARWHSRTYIVQNQNRHGRMRTSSTRPTQEPCTTYIPARNGRMCFSCFVEYVPMRRPRMSSTSTSISRPTTIPLCPRVSRAHATMSPCRKAARMRAGYLLHSRRSSERKNLHSLLGGFFAQQSTRLRLSVHIRSSSGARRTSVLQSEVLAALHLSFIFVGVLVKRVQPVHPRSPFGQLLRRRGFTGA